MKYSPELAQANTILCLEIFCVEAKRISLRHTLGYSKQLVLTHLLMVRPVEKALPDESPRKHKSSPTRR